MKTQALICTEQQVFSLETFDIPALGDNDLLIRNTYSGVSVGYLARQNEALDFINLRLASIVPDERELTPRAPGPLPEWALGSITLMWLGDTVRCLTLAAEAPHKAGVRIMNAVGVQANVAVSVPDLLRAWYGDDAAQLDFSHYEQPGHERDAVYAIDRIREELGFVPAMNSL